MRLEAITVKRTVVFFTKTSRVRPFRRFAVPADCCRFAEDGE